MLKDRVAKISGTIWNNTSSVLAKCVNRNADVLKELCEEVDNIKKELAKENGNSNMDNRSV